MACFLARIEIIKGLGSVHYVAQISNDLLELFCMNRFGH